MAKQKLDLTSQQVGDYKIVRSLGSGGMSVVFEAIECSLNRPVALKILPPQLAEDEHFVERFLREARAAAGLSHPNIITIYGTGEADGYFYIAMELVEGETLAQLLAREGPLGVKRALEISLRIAEALAFAHTKDFVHRDVKPSNIMVDRDGNVKLLDFGLAKALQAGPDLTSTGQILGTPMYMSPEQAKGERVDAASDVYALGVVMFQMLAGKTPYPADSPLVTLNRIVNEPVPDVRRHNVDVSDQLALLIGRMTNKNPALRVTSALPLVPQLTSILYSGEGHRNSQADRPTISPVADAEPAPRIDWRRAIALSHRTYFVLAVLVASAGWWLLSTVGKTQSEAESTRTTRGLLSMWQTTPQPQTQPPAVTLEPSPFKPGELQKFDGMDFVWIPPGTFLMGTELSPETIVSQFGSEEGDTGVRVEERPQHWVTITRGFWLSKYEVTKLNWSAISSTMPWKGQRFSAESANSPAENLSWNDCERFIARLNQRTSGGYRLPTEAEWEYACRAGSASPFYFGEAAENLEKHAWFAGNSAEKGEWHANTVGGKEPNPWGLHDMAGNVFEWCADGPRTYTQDAQTNPRGSAQSSSKILRGGSWGSNADRCRSAARTIAPADKQLPNYGLRLVRDHEEP